MMLVMFPVSINTTLNTPLYQVDLNSSRPTEFEEELFSFPSLSDYYHDIYLARSGDTWSPDLTMWV